jgi:DNA polymerase III alpha subunit (gram-positive type)
MSDKKQTYYFVDIESTGVDLKNDRIIQLAFLKEEEGKLTAFNDLCYTDVEMNETVIAIHHITNAMLEDKFWPYETDAFLELEKGNVEGNFFVSHGNELDVAMLENEELELKMSCVDTDKCSRILLKAMFSPMVDKSYSSAQSPSVAVQQ